MKILFIVPGLAIGGTTTVLRSIIKLLEKQKHEVKVLSLFPSCSEDQFADKQITLKGQPMIVMTGLWRVAFKECGIMLGIVSLYYATLRKIFNVDRRKAAVNKTAIKINKEQYDLVIGMEEGIATLVTSKVKACKKLAWIHCDYSRYLALYSITDESEIYSKFDQIICVSKYTAEVFSNHYHELASKTTYIHNPIDVDGILEKAKNEDWIMTKQKMVPSVKTLVSIGRLDPVKRFHMIPEIASYLKGRGQSFIWYIVGDGGEKPRILEEISRQGVEREVIMTGAYTNPYPLLSRATMLIILSESEACPSVMHEAMILNVPVISTDYPTAYEFITNEWNGLVVPIDRIPEKIIESLQNGQLLSQLCKNKINYQHYNETIKMKILGLFEKN